MHQHDLARIPKRGPCIIIANKLIHELDERVLASIFQARFPDFQFLDDKSANPIPLIKSLSLPGRLHLNLKADSFLEAFQKTIKEAGANKGVFALIADFSGSRFEAVPKSKYLKKLFEAVRQSGLPVLPVRLDAPEAKSWRALVFEEAQLHDIQVVVRIGNPVSVEEQMQFEKGFWKFIRSKIYALGTNLEVPRFFNFPFRSGQQPKEPVIEPVNPELVAEEIANLTFENLVTSQANFDVLVASAKQIPNTLNEIGRLRETTFRMVGEGTGKPLDLDEFDLYYLQLIIWDRDAKRIVGGYRLGKGDEIFARYGVEGFYVSSLFKIKEGFYPILQQAVELGRSYVVEDYQRKRLPLFLLWRGILFFLLQHPQYRYLYGPLSISKHYSNVSKSLIVEFIKRYYFDRELAKHLKPRKPFKVKLKKIDIDLLLENMPPELSALDTFIEDIEPDHFRMPVLLKQYAKQNARFISFNVDPSFSNVLDGFMILDLKNLPLETIELLKKEKEGSKG